MSVQQPESINVTLTITMPMRDWNRLREQLPREYPSWRLGDAISDAVRRMGQVVDVESMDVEP